MKKSDTQWSVNLYTSDLGSTHVACPLPTTVPSVPLITCADPNAPDFGLTVPGTISSLEGPAIDGINANFPNGCGHYTLEIICTGTEEDIETIEDCDPEDSPGFDTRPYTDAAIMLHNDGEDSFWSGDFEVTSVEQVQYDEDADSGGCNTFVCAEVQDVIVYLRGPDPNFAFIESNDIDSSMWVLCPEAGRTITVTPTCGGIVGLATGFTPTVYAKSLANLDAFTCPGGFQEGVQIRCAP